MSTDATNQQTIQTYDQGVATYIATLPDLSEEVRDWIGRSLNGLGTTAKILEIGSASGRDADYIESLGYVVERTDASQGFVDYMQTAGKTARLFNVLTDTMDGPYDLVYANAVFLHFTDDEFRLGGQKVYNALQSGGRFALTLKRGTGHETTTRKMDAPRYFRLWEPDEVRQVLESIGFTNIRTTVADDGRADRPQWVHVVAEKGARA